MAKSATVGSLRVQLGLDSAQFAAGLQSAQSGLQRFAGIAKTGALAIGTAMVAAGGALAVAMKGVIDDADEMSKMAQKIGVPIEELSRLRYAAELSDVSLEDLGKSLKRLSAGMLDASETATGPAARAFAMLGIQVRDTDGNIRSSTSVIEDLAARFAKMPNGVEKTALAMRIFGKSGADMIPLLNSGSDGLREMYAEAEQLGIVLDDETGRAAEAFNDNLTRMGRIKDGIVTKITAGMLPALLSLTDGMVVAAKDTRMLEGVGAGLGWTLKALATVAIWTGTAFVQTAKSIGAAAEAAWKWSQQDYAGAVIAWTKADVQINAMTTSARAMTAAIWAPPTGGLDRPPAAEGLDLVRAAGDGARRSTERLTEAQREAQRVAQELARAGLQTYEQTRTPAEQYAARVEELRRQLAGAAINQDTFNRAMREAQIAYDDANPLSQAGRRIAEENRENAERAREAAIELAKDHQENLYDATYDGVRGGLEAAADGNFGEYLAQRIRSALFDNLATSITDMLRGSKTGPSGGGARGWLNAVGSVLKSFSGGVPGFKTGGSFKVGGSGGADSQLMQFRATPGEMVDIRRPGQDQGGGAMAVHVVPSPYFDVQVEKVSAPLAIQAASTAYGATNADMARAQRRGRQRFV